MEAVFRAPAPYAEVNITYPVYAESNRKIELRVNGKGAMQCIGTNTAVYRFCNGADHNQITLTDTTNILRLRDWITRHPEFVEVSCDKEAEMLGGGVEEPVGDDRHAKHKEELMRKYGGDEEQDYSEWDKTLSKLLR